MKTSFFLALLVPFGFSLDPLLASAPTSVVAKVNGEVILEQDLLMDTLAKTREEKIKRAIQFRLLLQEAKRRGLDRSAEMLNEVNALLYKKLIDEERKNRRAEFNPSEEELKNYYETAPLIRMRHLVLANRSETEKQIAGLSLQQIKKEIKKGTSFDKLCMQYSQESSGPFGGDTDFKGLHNFPEEFYKLVLKLKQNEVSGPIEVSGAYHLLQWFEEKPFTSAPASYLQFLQAKLTEQKERTLLTDMLKGLESRAEIVTNFAITKPGN